MLGSVHEASNIENAFRTYDFARRQRTQKLVVTRPDAGEVYEFEGEGVGDDLKALKGDLRGRYEWI